MTPLPSLAISCVRQAPVDVKKSICCGIVCQRNDVISNPAKYPNLAWPVLNRPVPEFRSELLIKEVRYPGVGIRHAGQRRHQTKWIATGSGQASHAATLKLCGGSCCDGIRRPEKVIEDGAVLDHCSALLFGGGRDLAQGGGDGVSAALVFHNAGIVNRDIGCALLKVGLGITTSLKKCGDQVVGLSNSSVRVINEAGLHRFPLGYESLPFRDAEFANFQCAHAGFTIGQLCFGLARRTMLQNRTIIL